MSQQSSGLGQYLVCPSCGAAVPVAAEQCWLCQWDLREAIVEAELVEQPPARAWDATRFGLWLGVGLLGILTVGAFILAPGIGALLAIVFVIALLAVTQDKSPRVAAGTVKPPLGDAYASPATQNIPPPKSNIMLQVLTAIGIVVLIYIGAGVAFLVFCAIAISTFS